MKESYTLTEKIIVIVAAILIIWGIVFLIIKYEGNKSESTEPFTANETVQESEKNPDTSISTEDDDITSEELDQENIPF